MTLTHYWIDDEEWIYHFYVAEAEGNHKEILDQLEAEYYGW